MDYSRYLHSANKPTTNRDASSPKFDGKLFPLAVPVIIELFGVLGRQFWGGMALLIVEHRSTLRSSYLNFPISFTRLAHYR